ncbi:MAG TPA: hypothetical protein VKO18_17920 [Terriglobia bacterium]|nr:hypothetical protein [Terriglobia bacterium]
MYENKGNMDEMTARKSDIYGNMTRILQKNSGYDGQFTLIDRVFSLHEHVSAGELRRRRGDFEGALGSAGGPSIVFQCMGPLVWDADMKGNVCATLRQSPKERFPLEMLKMKIEPTMCMKTRGDDDKMPCAKQGFYTKMPQSHDV